MKTRNCSKISSDASSLTRLFFFLSPVDPCLVVMPPCIGEADRFSLEALRHIHKQLDDDNDGGIEVNESVEVMYIYSSGCEGDTSRRILL